MNGITNMNPAVAANCETSNTTNDNRPAASRFFVDFDRSNILESDLGSTFSVAFDETVERVPRRVPRIE
jgi:hypothetical protein